MQRNPLMVLLVAALVLGGCSPVRDIRAPAAPQPAAGGLSAESLGNSTYSGIYDQPITLHDGKYEGEPFAAGDTAHPVVELVADAALSGDLDGDGVDDAVVFLVERGGGTGAFVYVAAQLNNNGEPVDAGAVRIEDRVQIKSAVVDKGQVLLEAIMPGPGDGACCPTYMVSKRYELQAGRLAEAATPAGEPIKISAADLDGSAWRLVELGEGSPAAAGSDITLRFDGDQLSGSGGCNDFTGSYNLGKDNPFTMAIAPPAATMKVCPEPLVGQEAAYFQALEHVSQWGWLYGRLALYFADDQGSLSRLLYEPVMASE
jgi:heat shock protein HslJ